MERVRGFHIGIDVCSLEISVAGLVVLLEDLAETRLVELDEGAQLANVHVEIDNSLLRLFLLVEGRRRWK